MNTIKTTIYESEPAVIESQRMECLLMATDLLKASGRKRFKDEFFEETQNIVNHLMCYIKNGDMFLEKYLSVKEIEDFHKEETKQ